MPLFVVAEDFIGGPIIQDRKLLDLLDDLLDVAMKFLLVLGTPFLSLALDLAPEHVGHRFGDALPAPARQLARELFGLGIFDVEGHLPSSSISTFFLVR